MPGMPSVTKFSFGWITVAFGFTIGVRTGADRPGKACQAQAPDSAIAPQNLDTNTDWRNNSIALKVRQRKILHPILERNPPYSHRFTQFIHPLSKRYDLSNNLSHLKKKHISEEMCSIRSVIPKSKFLYRQFTPRSHFHTPVIRRVSFFKLLTRTKRSNSAVVKV
jgi:hypothetical protein